MYQQNIPLSATAFLALSWDKNWENLTIRKDNEIVGAFAHSTDLKAGRNFQIPGHGTIFIRMDKDQIEAWQNGKDLASGQLSGQADHFKTAWRTLFLLAGIQLVFGMVACINNPEMPVIIAVAAVVSLFAGMGYWAKKAESVLPLWISAALIGLIGLVSLITSPSILTIVLIIVIIYVLVKGALTGPLELASRPKKKGGDRYGPLDSGI